MSIQEEPKTILVVDDEQIVLDVVGAILQRAGFHILTVESGQQALSICREHAVLIDVALVDVSMPVMDGLELRDCLKTEFPGIPVIFMSGYTRDQMEEHGITAPPYEFLEKPFTTQTLLVRIHEAMKIAGHGPAGAAG